MMLVGLSLLILVAGGFIFAPTVRAIFSPSSDERIVFADNLDDGGRMLRERATVAGNPVVTEYGLATPSGGEYRISWKGTNEPGELPFVRIWMYGGHAARNTVTFRSGQLQETVQLGAKVSSQLVYPRTLRAGAPDYEVTIISSLAAASQRPVFTLDRLELGLRVFPAGDFQKAFWSVLPCALLPWLAFFLATSLRLRRAALVVAGGAAVIAVGAGLEQPSSWPSIAAAVIVFALAGVLWMHWRNAANTTDGPFWLPVMLTVTAIVSAAFWCRWQWLVLFKDLPLLPDAITYGVYARDMKWGYDTGNREPFLIWLTWLFSTLTAWGPLTLRLLTVLISLAEGAVLMLLALEFMSLPWTMLVGMLYAFNPVLAHSAPLGLREELLPCAVLLFLFACVRAVKRSDPRPYHVLAVVAAVACVLTRLNAMAIVFPLYALFAWIGRWKRRTILLSAAAFAVVVAPHFIHNQVVRGDFLLANNIYGTWWRNFEFAGKPGFITREEFIKNGSAGTQITLGDYLFKHHRPVDLTTATAVGFWHVTAGTIARDHLLRVATDMPVDDFLNPTVPAGRARWFEWLIFGAFLVGLVVSLRAKESWCLPAALFLFVLPVSFIWGWFFGLLPVRLAINHAPIMLLLAGIGAAWLLDRARRLLAKPASS